MSAQIHCPCRRLDPERGLDRARERIGIGDGRVAGDTADQGRGTVELGSRHQSLDALVDITEALFQPHHRFAIGGEAEMPRLDDAGMDRTDRDLMQPFALDR
jgi:hypothetical protein